MLELKFAIYYRAASLPSQASYRISANRRRGVYLFRWSVWCGDYSRAAFVLLAHSTQPKLCQQAGKTFWKGMALTKASREINKNKLKMGKIGQVMSLAGLMLLWWFECEKVDLTAEIKISENQGVVTYKSPVEALATAIKNLDRWKSSLIAWSLRSKAFDHWILWEFKGQM